MSEVKDLTNDEKIQFIDDFLIQQEDVLHGKEGEYCTLSRKYLSEVIEAVREDERKAVGNEILKHSKSVIYSPIRFDGVHISKIEELTGTEPNF